MCLDCHANIYHTCRVQGLGLSESAQGWRAPETKVNNAVYGVVCGQDARTTRANFGRATRTEA